MIPQSFAIRNGRFELNGQPFFIRCGEIHYLRVPPAYWKDRLRKARAMGLNTVCAYVFWNAHEPRPGEFDFTGWRDVARFVRLAQQEGLWVLLRPGPYVCAEWDLGGLPAWLLATRDIRLRCSDPRFVEAATRYLKRLGQELAPLTISRGGPILMAQVENEYGAYGSDKKYLAAIRDAIRDAGFDDIPLFTCDWPNLAQQKPGGIDGCTSVANFGSNAAANIENFKRLRPDSPPMCGEFWSGWFDAWGAKRSGNADPGPPVAELKWMLENDVSWSLYMFHGGTSFGFSAGANQYDQYAPTVTNYDYWSALDEAGRPTAKFFAYQELLLNHQLPGAAPLLNLPEPLPHAALPEIELTEVALLFDNLPMPIESVTTRTMEEVGQSNGMILYRTDLSGQGEGLLRIVEPHDYALVYLNDRHVATLDRRRGENRVELKQIPDDRATLDILVDTTGRVNFGPHLADRKGITSHVEIRRQTIIMNWRIYSLPMDAAHLQMLRFKPLENKAEAAPAFFRGRFVVNNPADTWLDLRNYGRGVVWVNGNNLGRFWSIGPQQTLFLPGCWLKPGDNEIIVFDLEPTGERRLSGLTEPILNETRQN